MMHLPVELTIIVYIVGLATGVIGGWFGQKAVTFGRRVLLLVRIERERKAREQFARDLDLWMEEIEREVAQEQEGQA